MPCLFVQAALQQDLSRVMQEAVKQRQRYVESFKDLTAAETKTTEIIDKNGKVEDRRVVVSDFLVYESRLKAGVVNEYRITREVDGKPAAKDLADPFGTIIIKKGDVRTGGSYWNRYSKIAVWNSLMDENDYLVKRWTEFLTA